MKPILEVHHLAKKYKIKHLSGGYLSLRERMLTAFKPGNGKAEDFWAVNDVSFEVQAGESIAIIGHNGAGKSTLLKILSKITPPTKGKIITRGRMASLLEVGTGFHPELTGRENIFFNGSLLGMKRKEIEAKFDEIIDFAGVEKFLDTPLKHYSSGMQLRLAFSVAAFLEPEILVIDEVLAVGDAEFQKKCLGKMEDVSKSGRTILFVSHDLAAVEKLCPKTILLKDGKIHMADDTGKVINHYLHTKLKASVSRELTTGLRLIEFHLGSDRIVSNATIPFDIVLEHDGDRPVINEFCIIIYTLRGFRVAILDLRNYANQFEYIENRVRITGSIVKLNLVEGEYTASLHYGINFTVGEASDLASISVSDDCNTSVRKYQPQYRGVMELDFKVN
ncbi:ABC transporter ATP-binding protein [Chryseolinea sp. H1M3-3]|uniref:ABC transporter ATP-binding protein n=1 Tax=Chryseolinea sp. H1M3-3 TaxID=3034144 RepID=UPI0023EE0CAD|nr:ABC transporter ATP-binding protein [Chryseolinea sp. H1M3-3]